MAKKRTKRTKKVVAVEKAAKPKYPPPYEYRFKAGPYVAPRLNNGAIICDEYAGDVEVVGMTDAAIPWPAYRCTAGRRASPMPILFGGLVRAVCEEEELVVAHYWGVTRHMVNRWKSALAKTEDSNEVAVNLAMLRADPEFRKKYYRAT